MSSCGEDGAWRCAPAGFPDSPARSRTARAWWRAPISACGSRRVALPPPAISCATPSPTSAATPIVARSWARFARRSPSGARLELLDLYPRLRMPVLLLWADNDPLHPLAVAEEARDLIEGAVLRVLPGTGYLIAYDDPVGVAREISAFCG